MPELPEVETTLRGIEPHVLNKKISSIVVRQSSLRWPVPTRILKDKLIDQTFTSIKRRGKYLLLESSKEFLIIHLGMSGSLRIIQEEKVKKHDHIDIEFKDGSILRYCDPRRFGCFLWTENPESHPLLKNLGPEPLGNEFNGQYLFNVSRGRKTPIKSFIMNSKFIVGVGNIYANEALFRAKIKPNRQAGRISLKRYEKLSKEIVIILRESIEQGGTTLRDFVGSNNKPGYFKQQLEVYGRQGEECKLCSSALKSLIIGQRSSVYCPKCQN